MEDRQEVDCVRHCTCPKCGTTVKCNCDCHSETKATCPKCGEVFDCK